MGRNAGFYASMNIGPSYYLALSSKGGASSNTSTFIVFGSINAGFAISCFVFV